MIILTAYNATAAAQDHITAPRPPSGLGFLYTTPNQDQNQLLVIAVCLVCCLVRLDC
jgi:hypothetical protein